jgi:uncharacterized membrane protein YhaH (DUF805 family)
MNGRNPLRWDGSISGKPYLLVGLLLTAAKIAIDHTVADRFFGRTWTPWRYVFPGELLSLENLPREDRNYYVTMAAIALPFVIIGVNLTYRRLRDAGLPVWLVPLFFLPLPFNVIFFLVLAAWPSRSAATAAALKELPGDAEPAKKELLFIDPETPGRFGALLPENDMACGAVAILLTIPITLVLGILSVGVFSNYGWGLFVGIPFVMPMLAVMTYGQRKPRSVGACLSLGLSWLMTAFLALVIFAFEGVVCLVLLMPLAIPIVLAGALTGYLAQLVPWTLRSPGAFLLLLASLPTMIGAEGLAQRTPPLFPVTTSVEVDAPPAVVWEHVVTFSELPPPDDWLFRTGVAYPVRATIEGRGPGAVRRCEFSTGAFVEPIEVWDEPRLLSFSVTSSPPPMKEWSPFADIHPPHLENYLVSRQGEFRLTPLPGGRTRLEGTTWYRHTMWPAAYWKIWSDGIIRRIHLQVLRHVKRLAEADRKASMEWKPTRRVHPAGLEPATYGSEDRCSIHLSYGCPDFPSRFSVYRARAGWQGTATTSRGGG